MHNLTFFGSDQYSALVLSHLIQDSRFKIQAVITTNNSSLLVGIAKEHSLPLIPYESILKSKIFHLSSPQSLGIVASFGHILPPKIINQFPRGILCLHPSLLPQYRGATPVPHAIALGDRTTGITLFRLTEQIDQGEILAQIKEPILPTDTSPKLLTRLFTKGATLLEQYLTNPSDSPTPRLSDTSEFSDCPITFTHRFTRESGFVEWPVIQKLINNDPVTPADTNNSLLQLRLTKQGSELSNSSEPRTILFDLVRALHPWPALWTIANTKRGPLRLSLVPAPIHKPSAVCYVLLSGKPHPISWADFTTYYL